jgi:hypothetical protein
MLAARDDSVPVNIISYASAFSALLQEAEFAKHAQFPECSRFADAGYGCIFPGRESAFKPCKTKELLLKPHSGKNPGYIEGSVHIKTDIPNLPEKSYL